MYFCIRDDDTNFFTSPEDLERAYGKLIRWGPVSLAVVPFHKAGTSKAVPERFRGNWTIHPLHENRELVDYLSSKVRQGSYEIMLHGYYHDDQSGRPEFLKNDKPVQKIMDGRKYLEDIFGTSIRVFVPPHNTIGPEGLHAVAAAGLHLGGVGGFRSGWPLVSHRSWFLWLRLRFREMSGRLGIPWILDLGDHREIVGHGVVPSSSLERNKAIVDSALRVGGVFCLATHYWELPVPSTNPGDPTVGEHVRLLVDYARSDPQLIWRSVGDIVSESLVV